MAFIEGSRGIYQPIRVLFQTPIYEQAVDGCWYVGSYKFQIAVLLELMRLQREHQLTAAVTAEDMCDLLVEETRQTLRVQLWEWKVEGFDEDVQPLIKLVWHVNTSMKMRDVTTEANRLLDFPEDIPHQFRNPKILREAQSYAERLREQQKQPPQTKVMDPREVVLEVVPKVLQGFWVLPENIALNMPSQALSKMVVGATKAVEDQVSAALSSMLLHTPFPRFIRDNLVLSVLETVGQFYTDDVLQDKVLSFDAELLTTITKVVAGKICELFEPQPVTVVPVEDGQSEISPAGDVGEESGLQEDVESDTESTDWIYLTPTTEPGVVQSDVDDGLDEAEEESVSGPEADTDLFPATPALVSSADEAPPAIIDVQEPTPDHTVIDSPQTAEEQRETDCAVVSSSLVSIATQADWTFSPNQEDIPLQFRNTNILREAQSYTRRLREQQEEPLQSKVMDPREVVLEVVPKVNMPPQALSKIAVGATKAVEDQVSAALSSMLLHTDDVLQEKLLS